MRTAVPTRCPRMPLRLSSSFVSGARLGAGSLSRSCARYPAPASFCSLHGHAPRPSHRSALLFSAYFILFCSLHTPTAVRCVADSIARHCSASHMRVYILRMCPFHLFPPCVLHVVAAMFFDSLCPILWMLLASFLRPRCRLLQ